MNDTEQRKAAAEFVKLWKNKGDEKQHTQQFWSDLLHRVYGIVNFSDRVEFEKRVPLLHTSFIDVYIPETHVIIEQKSMDIDLLKRKKQSDGVELNPFEQAQRYGGRLPFSERPRWIVTCNFQRFLVYDMNEVRPEENPIEILLEELPEKYHLLSFLIDPTVKKITVEQQLSFKAGELVGKLYDLMLPLYKDPTADSTLQSLNKFCVRIVFCLYAEDAMLFGPKGSEFHDYLESDSNTRRALIQLFKILDQPEAERDQYTEPILMDFPYVNGGLFSGDIEIPIIPEEVRNLILVDMSENLDWSKISPTIFGAVFESTLNPETRRSGGMHYTSIKDIHKVIDPLFLDGLEAEFDKILTDKLSGPKRKMALENFHKKLAILNFLDPACGSGNFLTETYLSLRRLENKVIEQLQHGMMVLEFANPVKVSIGQFAGIEINDFAVTVARTALWIAESQMIKETEAIVNQTIEFFPLKTDAKIVEGNALRMDWNEIVDRNKLSYIMGNPPFNGARTMSVTQKNDMIQVVETESGDTEKYKNFSKNLDYVCAWYFKATRFIKGTRIKVGFVSTSSICQGQQVYPLWNTLINDLGMKICFAYKPFKWSNEAENQAQVVVTIVSFAEGFATPQQKIIYEGNGQILADNISPYLINSKTVIIKPTNNPINEMPKMIFGNMPRDGGHFIFSKEEGENLIKIHPELSPYILKYIGGEELMKNTYRYCLWLLDAPQEIKEIPFVRNIIKDVYNFRIKSKAHTTNQYAKVSYRFAQVSQPKNGTYIALPEVSSGNRMYIPMGYFTSDVIASNKLFIIERSSLYHFGVLTSIVHMAWMRIVAGRLGMGYNYSSTIVYNNFPWPNPTDNQKEKIMKTAQEILNARKLYPKSSLTKLYEIENMPLELYNAHNANDKAVMSAYGFRQNMSEEEIVAELFKMYESLTKTAGSKP